MSDLAWGLQMTVLGMGLVFGLLALLWGLLTLVQRLDREPAIAPEPVPAPLPATSPDPTATAAEPAADGPAAAPAPATEQGLDAELVAAIMVATLRHRAILRREAAPAMRSFQPGSLLHASRWLGAGRARQNTTWQRRSR